MIDNATKQMINDLREGTGRRKLSIATPKTFEGQRYAVQNMAHLSRWEGDTSVITRYEVEELTGGHVYVKRSYKSNPTSTVTYNETFIVGPRGGVKKGYSSISYGG